MVNRRTPRFAAAAGREQYQSEGKGPQWWLIHKKPAISSTITPQPTQSI
jgi:hypothetical protein